MDKLIVATSPHIRTKISTQNIMLDVLIALAPAAIAGTVLFGLRALLIMAVCVASAVLSEFLFNIIVKKEQTIKDLSAAVTGLILALCLPVKTEIWQCVIGSVFAIIIVKCVFGYGYNFTRKLGRLFFKARLVAVKNRSVAQNQISLLQYAVYCASMLLVPFYSCWKIL